MRFMRSSHYVITLHCCSATTYFTAWEPNGGELVTGHRTIQSNIVVGSNGSDDCPTQSEQRTQVGFGRFGQGLQKPRKIQVITGYQ
ncbi:hypothetical protein F4604DRAFT_1791469 [Suillus subluteus]|nr:hypothetical protein F4604DRAFT_1791469 [Suillus subluteus]